MDNIRSLLAARLAAQREDLQVSITMVLMRENLHELTGFIALASDLKVPAVIWNLKFNNSFYSSSGFTDIHEWSVARDDWKFSYSEQLPHLDSSYSKVIEKALELAKNLKVPVYGLSSWPNELTESNPIFYAGLESKPSDCPYYKNSLYVSSNGDVRMCCYQIGSQPIDNISKKTADAVWNGLEISKIRSELANDKVPAICSAATCQFVRGS